MTDRTPLWLEDQIVLPDEVLPNSPSGGEDTPAPSVSQETELQESSVQVDSDPAEEAPAPQPFSLSQGIFHLHRL